MLLRWLVSRWRWLALGAAGLVGFLAIADVVLKLAPDWFAVTSHLDAKAQADARQGVRTASLALLAGTIGVVGAVYTARSFALNRAGQLTDRFTKAIEQLGHKEAVDVRLGGIYALERIARDSKEDHSQVVEVLTAYVRGHAPRASKSPSDPDAPNSQEVSAQSAETRPDTDVQAVLTVLGRRTLAHEQDARPALNLSVTALRGADLHGAKLRGADLRGADLRGADLSGAALSGAALVGADLSGADLSGADLHEAVLLGADLLGADLRAANLHGAGLYGANLSVANLHGADLREANLHEADLSAAELGDARYNRTTVWPERFDPYAHGARLEGSG